MPNLSITQASLPMEGRRQGIVWLASYPKSGNTWFRIFLRNLLHEPEEETELSGVPGISTDRTIFDAISGLDSSDLTNDEVDILRPRVYEEFIQQIETLPIFIKAHDAYTYLPNGEPLLAKQATAGAIYFLRNPLDVAVSAAYHSGHEDFAKAVKSLATKDKRVSDSMFRLESQISQRYLDWSSHVTSWLDQTDVAVHVVKYEDMLSSPLETFRGAIRFAGLEHDDAEIATALEASRFEKLQQTERERGFRERLPQSKALFFREGKAGGWRDKLTGDLVTRVISDHGDVMRRVGYLDDNNTVLI